METVSQKSDHLIPLQKLGKALLDQKVENTTVPLPQKIPKHPEFTTQRLNAKWLKAWAKHYKALTWAEEDILEDSDYNTILLSTDLEEDRVYLIRCLDTGILQALELYNDTEEGIDIHYTETVELPQVNILVPGKGPVKVPTEKQTKHTNSQWLVEEAAKETP